jgi:hypothetical protein
MINLEENYHQITGNFGREKKSFVIDNKLGIMGWMAIIQAIFISNLKNKNTGETRFVSLDYGRRSFRDVLIMKEKLLLVIAERH